MIGAVDIGGTKIAIGIVDENGKVLAKSACPTAPENGAQDAVERIAQMLNDAQSQTGVTLRGIGIGSTGPIDPLGGTVGDVEFLPGWEGFNLITALQERFHLPVALENDADAAALGEFRWGAGKAASKFVYVTVGTGIGVGLVFDGRLYRGVGGAHPEIGHHVIDPSGPPCYCGASGCWESLASGTALAGWFNSNYLEEGDAETICDAAEVGHAGAKQAVDQMSNYLGIGLANLVTIFVPEVIALGGGLMQSRHLFWDDILETVEMSCGYVPVEQVRIVPAALAGDVGVIGAACAWLHRFENERA